VTERPKNVPDSSALPARVRAALEEALNRHAQLNNTVADVMSIYQVIIRSYDAGGVLYLCGNGGSFADCLHISGELLKAFEKPRPLTARQKARFKDLPDGVRLAEHLEKGLPAVVLGANLSLSSAVLNDKPLANMNYAQELFALGRPGDVLLGISTSGNARNVLLAAQVAKAKGLEVIALTGSSGGKLGRLADVTVRVPARKTREVQELHQPLYHALCAMLEEHYFGKPGR